MFRFPWIDCLIIDRIMQDRQKLLHLLDKIKTQLEEAPELNGVSTADLEKNLQAISDCLKPVKPGPATDSIIHIWSDGACSGNPGPGGWGTIILRDGVKQELSGYHHLTTNNIMEMTGALEGIRQTPEGCRLIITSDSQYLVKGMTTWMKSWKNKNWKKADGKPVLNKSIWMALDKEAGLRDIQWQWIKGHAGHPQNERCDELARNAIAKGVKT